MTDLLRATGAIRKALDQGRAVVALETSVLSHGLPPPWNLRAADAIDRAVRDRGAEPAWTWVADGVVRVGATEEDLGRLTAGPARKVARRDLPLAVSRGALGATTVSAAVWIAARAGLEVAATGGIGGVHPGTGDVSADLAELGRSPVTLVCSGPKVILDPAATLERLEEVGVAVIGYRTDRLPFFVVRNAGLALEHRLDDPGTVAEAARARRRLGAHSALLVCQPVPEGAAVPAEAVARAVGRCTARAQERGIAGKDVTPFLLSCLAEETEGATLRANLALLEANSALAADIAAAL